MMSLKQRENTNNRWLAGALVVVCLSLVLRVWGSNWGLPHLYHPDENKIVNHALAFGKGDLNPHYFGWPSLQMYVMFFIYGCYFLLGWLMGFFSSPESFIVSFATDPSNFYLLGRWFSGLLGALTVWLTYATGRRLYNCHIGFIGAVFLAVNYLHVKDSHYITPDVPISFMVMAVFWFAVKIFEAPRFKHYAAAGILTGLAISVKYPAFVIAFAPLTAHLIAVKTQPDTVRLLSRRACIAALLVPLAFVIGTPYSVLDANNFLIDLWHQKLQVSRPLPLLERMIVLGFENPIQVFGVGVYLCGLAGLIRCLCRRDWSDILLLSFPVAFFAFLLVTGGLQHRYLMPILPFLCLLAALFLVEGVWFITWSSRLPRVLARLVLAVAMVAVVVHPTLQSVVLDLSLIETDPRTRAKEWIEQHIQEGARIAVDSYGPPLLSTTIPVAQPQQPTVTTREWQENRDQIKESSIYRRVKTSRLGQEWRQYNALLDDVKENTHQGRPRYVTLKLIWIPYIWQLRLETGEVTEEEVKRHPEFAHVFDPKPFLAKNAIEYVVLNSNIPISQRWLSFLSREAELIHRVERRPPPVWVGKLPFYHFHDPTLEIYRLRPIGVD